MKLLLFSDLHCDGQAAASLVQRASDCDVVIGAGDLANGRRGLSICMIVLRQIRCPTILVPGNNESDQELTNACSGWSSAIVLHGTGTTIDGVHVFGLGGGVPTTPFGDWSFDLTEQQAEQMLSTCPTGGILVSHSPPKGMVDTDSGGRSLGSVAVRAAMDRTRPKLVVCGHIHASAGQQVQQGPTTVVNAGPAGIVLNL